MVQQASASPVIPFVDRCEPEPWTPGPIFRTLERALDVHDFNWADLGPSQRELRRHRRQVVSCCVEELRSGAKGLMEDWRRQAAARADYSGPDPVLQMLAIHGLLLVVEAQATWTLTLGMPAPAGMTIEKLRSMIQPLQPSPITA
jgi:hypothetical protein